MPAIPLAFRPTCPPTHIPSHRPYAHIPSHGPADPHACHPTGPPTYMPAIPQACRPTCLLFHRPAYPHACRPTCLPSHRPAIQNACHPTGLPTRTPVIPPSPPNLYTTRSLLPGDKSSKRTEKVLGVLDKLLPSPPSTLNNLGLGNFERLPRSMAG